MKRQGVNWAKILLHMAANDRPPQAFSLLHSMLGEHILFVLLLSGYCVISGFERHLGLADHLPRFESHWEGSRLTHFCLDANALY